MNEEEEEVQLYLRARKNIKISYYLHISSIIIAAIFLAISIYKSEESIYFIISGYWIGWFSCQFTAISQKELVKFLEKKINRSKKSLDYLLKINK